MRIIFFALVLAACLFSCNNASTDKKADADSTQNAATTTPAPRTVADAITDLKNILLTGNKSTISDQFDFPLADTVMPVFLDDSTFSKNYNAAGGKLTKNLFLSYYDTIAKFNNLVDIVEGLKILPIDSLRYKNEIRKQFVDKNSPCTREYSINIEGDRVTLVYSTGFNTAYKIPKGKDAEAESAGCEFASFWIFRFDGNKLKFERQGSAG